MSDEKWRSKNGHAVSSDVTDKIPPKSEVYPSDKELIHSLLCSLKGASIELNRRNRYDCHAETSRVLANISYTIKIAEQIGGK